MTDKKISDLTTSTALAGTDTFEIDTGTASKKVTAAVMGDYVETRASLAESIRDTVANALIAGSNMTVTINDIGDTITLSSATTGTSVRRHPGYISGHWYRPGAYGGASVSSSVSNIVAVPFVVPEDVVLTDIGVRVTNAGTGNSVFGIYSHNISTHLPDALMAQSAQQTTTSAQAANLTTTFATPLSLSTGFYWMAFNCDVSGTFFGCSSTEGQVAWMLGTTSSTISTTPQCLAVASSYSSTMPSTFPAGATPNTTACPLVHFKTQ